MKRNYKQGDWLRVPLDAQTDALGVIARACRSRLFGYFFAFPAHRDPSHEELKRLRAGDAAACALFGGAALEESRWTIVATSVPFDCRAWPFPQFASRGAFGRVWTSRTYDPDTLQLLETQTIDADAGCRLPDARFANAGELEDLLRERICGIPPRGPLAVYELRPGFDSGALHVLSHGGRVQFSEAMSAGDLERIANFIAQHPQVELRVHGFSTGPFDVRDLRMFRELRALTLDARMLDRVSALSELVHLQRLRIGPQSVPVQLCALREIPSLRELELHGKNADIAAIAPCSRLELLCLVDTPPVEPAHLACAPALRELTIAHSTQPLTGIKALPLLERLELRDMQLRSLPDLYENEALECVILRAVRELKDLAPLQTAGALRELEISGSPQLGVEDFSPLAACPNLRRVHVEIGSRRKEREVYRLLHVGKKEHEVFRH